MKTRLLLIFLITFNFGFGQIPSKQAKADIDFLIQSIEEIHPVPFYKSDEDEFYKQMNSLKEQLPDSVSTIEIARLINPVLCQLSDVHTRIPLWNIYGDYINESGLLFPFEIKSIENKLIVVDNYSDADIAPGNVIVSINGIPSKEILSNLYKNVYGSNDLRKQFELENTFKEMLWFMYGLGEQFDIVVDEKTYQVKGRTKKEIDKQKKQRKKHWNDMPFEIISDSVGLFVIDHCHFPKKYYKKRFKEVFSEIKEKEINHLILDIRYNTGGESFQVWELMNYLLDKPFSQNNQSQRRRSKQFDKAIKQSLGIVLPIAKLSPYFRNYYKTEYGKNAINTKEEIRPKNNKDFYSGKLYVLIGPENVSSGTEIASYLKNATRGVFIGQETGSTLCECGSAIDIFLPNSQLGLWISTDCSISEDINYWENGIKPDIEIVPSIKELTSRKDITLEKTLEYINSGQ
jgi:C-terminal processing protease CtpA/Prc